MIGSTLIVYPAAFMPEYAVRSGAALIIVNVGETPLDDLATVRIEAKAGPTMTAILDAVRRRRAAQGAASDR